MTKIATAHHKLDEIISNPNTSYDGNKFRVVDLPKKQHLSNSQRAFLDLAVRLAETADAEQRHGCVVVKSGSVISMGVNKWRNRQLVLDTAEDKDEYNENLTTHAEIDALSRAKNAKGSTVYIARVGKHGAEMFSRPCPRCEQALVAAGVKRIIYTA